MIGQTLGHYSIVEKIGAGGMGVVYRAHDEQLGRDVALKVLHPGTLDDEAARRQFRKEAMALARLNHPNIATVFEFSSQDKIDFLAMELIPGVPLNQKIKAGPIAEKESLRLAAQLADGLAAAHEQGVIHRDLKPANLFITPDGRLKILDFGLAKFIHPEPANAATVTVSTDTSSISGTLPYMSPEQLRGMPVDARSDVYAAGAVLYEMATAQRPFPQTQGAVLTGAILHETPPLPQSVNSRVSLAISNVIMKALEKEPTRRYQSARELGVALEGLHSGTHHVNPDLHAERRRFLVVGVAALALVVLAGAAIGFNVGGLRERIFTRSASRLVEDSSSNKPIGPVQVRRSVAVFGFKNLSQRGDATWISTALTEILTSELRAGEKLQIVSGEQVAQVKMNLALPDADSFAKETLGKIRQNTGSDAIVLGSYLASGNGQVRVDMHLQDVHTGETLASVTENGPESDLSDIASRASAKLRETLGAGAVSSAEAASARLSIPSNPTAMRFYSEGVERLHALDAAGAKDLLLKAIAADPKFAPSYAALTQAWRDLGREKEARDSIKKALDLSDGLPSNERTLIEANYHQVYHEWQKAREAFERLYRAAPDKLEYGLAFASSQTKSGDIRGSYETVEALRKLPSPTSDSPRIDMVEADNAATEGDVKRVSAKYQAAVDKARASGARLILANSLNRQAFSLASSGEIDKGIAAAEEARSIYESVKDASGVAASKYTLATMLFQRGDLQDVEKLLKEVVQYGDKTGDKSYAVISLTVLAQTQVRQARLPEARKNYERVLAAAREQDDKYNEQFALTGIGDTLYDMGNRTAAKQYYEQSIALTKITGDKGNAASAQLGLSDILRTQGDVDGAMKLLQQAMAAYEELGLKVQAAQTLNAIAGMTYESGDSETAEKEWGKVRDTCQEAQIKSCVAKTNLSIAESLNNKGKNSEAAAQYLRAIDLYREMDEKGNLSLSLSSLAQVKLDVGDLASAVKFEEEAVAMARASVNKDILANALRVRGNRVLAQGKLSEAQKEFEQSLSIFKSLNMKEQVARGRRALGSLRESHDDLAAAQEELREASSIYKEIKATREIQSVQLSLARIELAQRQPERAEEIGKAALDEFVKAKSKEGEGAAHLVLAKALIAQGKPAEAQSELDAALAKIYAEEGLLVKTDLAIAKAEVKAASGKPEEGIPALEIALSDATSRGYVPVQYKVRLALGSIEMKAGRIASARTRLSTLQKDASAKGFLLIARRAKEAGEGRAAN